MSRLIDADALIEVIKESRPLNWTDSESELQEDADYNHFIEMVKEQPTAYDIEKVVAELEKQAEQYKRRALELVEKSTEAGIHNKGKACSYEHAIEIVRKGGV